MHLYIVLSVMTMYIGVNGLPLSNDDTVDTSLSVSLNPTPDNRHQSWPTKNTVALSVNGLRTPTVLDFTSNPVVSLRNFITAALAVANNSKTISYLLTMGIIILVCAISPHYCSLLLQHPIGRHAYTAAFTNVDELNGHLHEAINKYHELQSGIN